LSLTFLLFLLVITYLGTSYDNLLMLAEMVKEFPKPLLRKALRFGIVGQYAMQSVGFLFFSFLKSHPIIKIIGGSYLVYLMCKNLGHRAGDEETPTLDETQLWKVVWKIERVDFFATIDSMFAMGLYARYMWQAYFALVVGVLIIRILAMKVVPIIQRWEFLGKIAYLMVGGIGIQLLMHLNISQLVQFLTVVVIIVLGFLYDRVMQRPRSVVKRLLRLVVDWFSELLGIVADLVDELIRPLRWSFSLIKQVALRCVGAGWKRIRSTPDTANGD
jgi:predicted tellurium resistance membrane protein TerC